VKFKLFKNNINIILLLVVLFFALTSAAAFAAEKYPEPRGAVNDFANVIDAENAAKWNLWSRKCCRRRERRLS